jgi:hypothetical protein
MNATCSTAAAGKAPSKHRFCAAVVPKLSMSSWVVQCCGAGRKQAHECWQHEGPHTGAAAVQGHVGAAQCAHLHQQVCACVGGRQRVGAWAAGMWLGGVAAAEGHIGVAQRVGHKTSRWGIRHMQPGQGLAVVMGHTALLCLIGGGGFAAVGRVACGVLQAAAAAGATGITEPLSPCRAPRVCSELKNAINGRMLTDLGELEQNLVYGEAGSAELIKFLQGELTTLCLVGSLRKLQVGCACRCRYACSFSSWMVQEARLTSKHVPAWADRDLFLLALRWHRIWLRAGAC